MKIPAIAVNSDTSTDDLEGIALNQLITDRQIIDTIVSNTYTSKKWSSAIKIGDIWLSIPSKIISVYDPYEVNPNDVWKDPRNIPNDRTRILKDLGITKENPVNKDPLEKFVGFNSPSIENSVINSEAVGRLTNLVVQNNKSADKIFVLKFECRDMSIQNNIRPILAQALLSPFLPIHNADLNQLVNPPDENPELFIESNKAYIDTQTGQFKWGSAGLNDTYIYKDNVSEKDNTTLQQESLRLRVYWEIPFYVQLMDFSIQSLPDKRNAYQLTLTIRPVSLEPAFGGIPKFIKTDASLKRQIESMDILEKNYKGDSVLTRNIAKMLGLQLQDDNDNFTYNTDRKDYNIFDPKFDTQIKNITDDVSPLSHAVTFKINTQGEVKINNEPKKYITITSSKDQYPEKEKSTKSLVLQNNKTTLLGIIKTNEQQLGYGAINNYSGIQYTTNININELNNYAGNQTTIKSITNSSPNNNISNNYKFQLTPKLRPKEKPKNNFKLIQYNLKQFFKPGTDLSIGSNTGAGYELRKALFGKLLAKEDADIICLEELGNTDYSISELGQYIEELTGNKYNIFHASNTTAVTSGNLNQTIGVGLLSKYPGIVEKIDLNTKIDSYIRKLTTFSKSPFSNETTQIALQYGYASQILDSRPILKVTITRPEDSSNLVIFVCHFRSKLKTDNEIFRKFESFCLLDEILRLPEDQPYIVVGDFNYDLYSIDTIDLSSFNNNVLTWNESINNFEHHFRTNKGNSYEETTIAGPTALWFSSLDLVLANRKDISLPINQKPIFVPFLEEYYKIMYGVTDVTDFIKKTLMLSTLREKYPAETQSKIESYKLQKNIKNLSLINPATEVSGVGTFFNVEKNTDDPSLVTSMGFSILDNIFYSSHFFKNGNLKYKEGETKIFNNYNDRGKYTSDPKVLDSNNRIVEINIPERDELPIQYFIKNIVPIKENIDFFKKTQYSDHFPVISNFNWDITLPSINDNVIDPLEKVKQYFTTDNNPSASSLLLVSNSPKEYEFDTKEIEIFPYPNVNIDKLKQYINIFGGKQTTQDIISYKTITGKIRVILGIFFSYIANTYIFIYMNIDPNKNEFLPLSIEAKNTEPDIIESQINKLYASTINEIGITTLAGILESEITGEEINIDSLEIITNTPTRDIGQKIDKSLFYQYYNLIDNYTDINLSPGEVSTNISLCQPFRNYYLPLLEEFSTELKNFDWKYNFEIDSFGSFIFDTKNINREDYKLYFSRKAPNKFGSTFLFSVTRAISILARFNSAEPDSSIGRYLGEIANSVLYNSERIRIKANKISLIRNCTYEQALSVLINNEPINGEIPLNGSKFNGNYETNGIVTKNVVSAEIIYYLATQIAVILTLLDDEFRDQEIQSISANIDPVLDLKGNVLPSGVFRDLLYKELKYKANKFFLNQPTNYTKYIKTIERHLKLNNVPGVDDKASNINNIKTPSKKYLKTIDLVKDYRTDLSHMIDKIYFLYISSEPIKIIEAI